MMSIQSEVIERDNLVRIMETQLSNFPTLMEKLQYMSFAFDPDPRFTKEAMDIVRSNIQY